MFDPKSIRGLYGIVDPEFCRLPSLEVAEAMCRGGVKVIQFRAKKMNDGELAELGNGIKTVCAKYSIPFVLNDRADLAAIIGADGLHLGQDDLHISAARKIFGGIIGVSTHHANQVRQACQAKADWLGYGPVFSTTSKKNPDATVGLYGLREAVQLANVPVIGIGGINKSNAAEVFAQTQIAAVISAICASAEPEAATRKLVEAAM